MEENLDISTSDRERRCGGWVPGCLCACLLAAATPTAAAQTTPDGNGSRQSSAAANALRYLDIAGAPIAPLNASLMKLGRLRESIGGENRIARLREALAEDVDTWEWTYVAAIKDITGDDVDDAMVLFIQETMTVGTDDEGLPTFSFDSKSTFSARHGRTGRELWSITEKSTDGLTWIIEADVGRKARAGFILVKDQGWSTPQPWVELIAISGKNAHHLWQINLDSTYVSDLNSTHNEPWITGLGDFLPGRASDLLIGLVTHTGTDYSTIYDTAVAVINGRNGKRIDHPARELTVDWIPLPWAVGDQDGDGLRDYAFGNNYGVVLRQGPEIGDPPEAKLGGVTRLRKATTGELIWEEGGLDLGRLAFAGTVDQQFGDRRPEFFIWVWDYEIEILQLPIPLPPLPIGIGGISRTRSLTYVMDGGGTVRFMKGMDLIQAPGRIDDDEGGDFIGLRWPRDGKKIRIKLFAFNSYGEKLWSREHKSPFPEAVCKDLCITFSYIAGGEAGDLQPDGRKDLVFYVESERANVESFHHYTVSGLTGRKLHQGGEELWAPGFSFDRKGADLLETYRNEGSIGIKTRDGTDGSTLIKATLGSDLPAVRKDGLIFELGDVTGDGCSDLLFTIYTTGGTYAVVLDGGNGKPLWSEVLQGPKRAISIETTMDRNRAC